MAVLAVGLGWALHSCSGTHSPHNPAPARARGWIFWPASTTGQPWAHPLHHWPSPRSPSWAEGSVLLCNPCGSSQLWDSAHLRIDQRAGELCLSDASSQISYVFHPPFNSLRSFEGFCFCFKHVSRDGYWNPQAAGTWLAHTLAPLAVTGRRCFGQQGLF